MSGKVSEMWFVLVRLAYIEKKIVEKIKNLDIVLYIQNLISMISLYAICFYHYITCEMDLDICNCYR